MSEQNTLYLMITDLKDQLESMVDLFDEMRDELFYLNSERFSWDEEDAFGMAEAWFTEIDQDGWVSVFEVPEYARKRIIEMAEKAGWKVIEFEIVLRGIKSGNEKDE